MANQNVDLQCKISFYFWGFLIHCSRTSADKKFTLPTNSAVFNNFHRLHDVFLDQAPLRLLRVKFQDVLVYNMSYDDIFEVLLAVTTAYTAAGMLDTYNVMFIITHAAAVFIRFECAQVYNIISSKQVSLPLQWRGLLYAYTQEERARSEFPRI